MKERYENTMKKILMVLCVLCVLLSASGCTSRKTYETEDYEVYELISELDELKKDASEDNIVMDYKITRGFDGKYTVKLVFEFNGHNSEWKTRSFEIKELNEGFSGLEPDDIFTFKIDGKKYDYETAAVLLEHYSDSYIW